MSSPTLSVNARISAYVVTRFNELSVQTIALRGRCRDERLLAEIFPEGSEVKMDYHALCAEWADAELELEIFAPYVVRAKNNECESWLDSQVPQAERIRDRFLRHHGIPVGCPVPADFDFERAFMTGAAPASSPPPSQSVQRAQVSS